MRVAIVLFNLGGPDRPDSVEPFLRNLFSDPAIIRVPWPVRPLLARMIAGRRAPEARKIYENLGGGSPLLPNTREQANALKAALPEYDVGVFIAMRYWHPLTEEAVAEVKVFQPDRIVLLPLYPQFSTTTSGSSFGRWHKAARAARLSAPTTTICCYPEESGFVGAVATLVKEGIAKVPDGAPYRVLFTAHGLPESIVKAGDPYQDQVERTVAAVVARMGIPDLDSVVCYQSRVGPLKWIGPATDEEIVRAGRDQKHIVVAPVAFVSEHSETLVELDIEYRELAEESHVPGMVRIPTVGVTGAFVEGLARVTKSALEAMDNDDNPRIAPGVGCRECIGHADCPLADAA